VAHRVKVFFDGGYRPAPLGMELAVVAGGQRWIERDLGPGTSMDAEWLALIAAMERAQALGLADPVLLGDAAAVIAQATGRVRCPPAYRLHLERFRALPQTPGRLRIRYIRRAQNLAGIALAALHGR
jgi:ribonuclease HI